MHIVRSDQERAETGELHLGRRRRHVRRSTLEVELDEKSLCKCNAHEKVKLRVAPRTPRAAPQGRQSPRQPSRLIPVRSHIHDDIRDIPAPFAHSRLGSRARLYHLYAATFFGSNADILCVQCDRAGPRQHSAPWAAVVGALVGASSRALNHVATRGSTQWVTGYASAVVRSTTAA